MTRDAGGRVESNAPNDWSPVKVGSIGATYGGLAGKVKSDFGAGTARYVTFLNVLENVRIEPSLFEAVRVRRGESQNLVQVGDVLFNGTSETPGDLAMGAVVDNATRDLYLNSFCFGFRIKDPHRFDAAFLAYYFRGPAGRQLMSALAQGATRYNLSKRQFLALEVKVPYLAEQCAIAEALSDVDGLIAALEALIAKKQAIKHAAMQQLLTGKTRLPGFSGEWDVKRIGEFAVCTAGGTPSTRMQSYWGGSIRWMSSGELNMRRVHEVEGRITEEGLRNSSTKRIPPKCVLIGLAGQGKTRGTVAMNFVELCTNQSIAAILANNTFVSEYLYFHLDSRYDELRELSSGGGGRGGLNLTLIKSLAIPFPSVAEQAAIAAVLSDTDAEIAALEASRAKTHAIKQGMMQQLLTGRVRLVKPAPAEASF